MAGWGHVVQANAATPVGASWGRTTRASVRPGPAPSASAVDSVAGSIRRSVSPAMPSPTGSLETTTLAASTASPGVTVTGGPPSASR